MKKAAMVVDDDDVIDIVNIVANACRQNERNSLKAKVCVTNFQFNAEVSLKMCPTREKLYLGIGADRIPENRFYEILKYIIINGFAALNGNSAPLQIAIDCLVFPRKNK